MYIYIRHRAEHNIVGGRIKPSCVTALCELYRHVLKYVYIEIQQKNL